MSEMHIEIKWGCGYNDFRREERGLVFILRFEDYIINGAELKETNPLPDIKNLTYIHADYELTENIAEEEKEHIGKGMLRTILPYKIQDHYTRERIPRKYKAAVLENESLKAVFLLELGGRLWSLYDKKKNRELLYVNSVFQPANLALRNAWFSGGVEWNVGIKGHNPLTCEPLFAQSIDGNILRMYEYERIRDIVYSVSAMLDGDKLLIKIRIENTSDKEKYMYWWSNIAVPEEEGTRVIAPADTTFRCYYSSDHYILDKTTNPVSEGIDISYPQNLRMSQDFFYKIPKDRNKWIASVDAEGKGLLHFSSDRLIGRKTFLWGQGNGGKRWNSWLSNGEDKYIEIQAGLLHTQLEHFVMKEHSVLEWTECYTALDCDPEKVHSGDWNIAVETVENQLHEKFDIRSIDDYADRLFVEKEGELRHYGSGWGALENQVREKTKQQKISSLAFPEDSMTQEQKNWSKFLKTGVLDCPEVTEWPSSYIVSAFWLDALDASVRNQQNLHWYAYYQLGVMKYANGLLKEAENCFIESLKRQENVWSYRNLAYLCKNEYGDLEKAKDYIKKAMQCNVECRALYINYAEILTACKEFALCLFMLDSLPEVYREEGRLKLYRVICLMETGELEQAKSILRPDFIMNDVKEGELSISDIWHQLHTKIVMRDQDIAEEKVAERMAKKQYPLPKELDFRMHAADGEE